jgi:hypothetical protein
MRRGVTTVVTGKMFLPQRKRQNMPIYYLHDHRINAFSSDQGNAGG